MVKIGFIVEGDTEKILIESTAFRSWTKANNIEICAPVINAKGGGNLLPHHIEPMLAQFHQAAPEHIVILTDLENEADIDSVKARITTTHTEYIFVAVKAIEAWFLADTLALQRWLKIDNVHEAAPENTPGMPWERLKALAMEKGARGPGPNKPAFAMQMCRHHGFEIAQAANHPACHSAKLFHDTLLSLGSNQVPRNGARIR